MFYSYAYHGWPTFIILTWVLASFILPLSFIVPITINIYFPYFAIGTFFTYFTNIPRLFDLEDNNTRFADPNLYQHGRLYKSPTIESAGMAINLVFIIFLIKSRKSINTKRDEFRYAIF